MSVDSSMTPDPAFLSRQPGEQNLSKDALEEIQRQLRLLSARVERAEYRLGIEDRLDAPLANVSEKSGSSPVSVSQTVSVAAPPLPDPMSRGAASLPAVATPEVAPQTRAPQSALAVVTSAASSLPFHGRAEHSVDSALISSARAGGNPASGNVAANAQNVSSTTRAGNSPIGSTPERATPQRLLIDWENLIGGKWALWVGLFSLFLAIASFLAYTWKSLPPMPPAARVALGVSAGIALIGAGSFFWARTQRWFSEGLAGAGLAVLYLSIWAGAQQYHLLSFNVAFCAMGLTTTLGVYLAIRFDALSLSVLATLGGFLTPLLLHEKSAAGSELLQSESLSLLAYVAVLNAGILAVSLWKKWNGLSWLSFIATILLVGMWAIDDYSAAQRWPTFAYFSIYFLLFVGTSCFGSLVRREETAQPDLLLLFGATSVYALAGYGLIGGALKAAPGTFAFVLALFFGLLWALVKTIAPANSTLRQSAGAIALWFVTISIPIQFGQHGLAIGWCVEAGVLLLLGLRLRAGLLQRAGQIVWCLSLFPLLGIVLGDAPKPPTLFLNERALPLLLGLLATALVVFQHWTLQKNSSDEFDGVAKSQQNEKPLLDSFAPLYASFVVLGGAWLLAQEIYLWFSWHKVPTSGTWHAGALYTTSALGALYAAAAFAVGVIKRDLAVRLSAVAVVALALFLPAWTGLSFSTFGWTPFWNLRWAAYVVIALSLAAMGWMISRDAENFTSEEIENLGLWPSAVGFFTLLGMSIEIYCSFGRGAIASNGEWRASAFFAIAILWSVFATVMIHLSYAWRLSALRLAALGVGAVGSGILLVVSVGYDDVMRTPFWNLRALAFAVTVALAGVMAIGENRRADESETKNGGFAATSVWIALLSAGFLVWGLTQESYTAFSHFKSSLGAPWKLFAFFFISALWSAAMFCLLAFGLRRNLLGFRVASYSLAGLSSALLLWTATDATRLGWLPLFNARCGAFVLCAVLLGACSVLLSKNASRLTDWEQTASVNLAWLAAALLLWGITQEAYETCFYFRQTLGSFWTRWAQMVISLSWSVYGAALLIGGINRNYQPLRLAALGLLCMTVSKVFVFDLGFLSGPLRMFSLAGLGVALIFISWLYGRYAKGGGDAALGAGSE